MLVVLFYPTSAISTHVVDVNTNLFCILLYTNNDTFKSSLFSLLSAAITNCVYHFPMTVNPEDFLISVLIVVPFSLGR